MVRILHHFWRAIEARALGLCSLLAALVLAMGLAWPWHPGQAASSPAREAREAGSPTPASQGLQVRVGDGANAIELDATGLWALGRREVLTSVPWEPVRRRWAGVSLRAVLEHAGLAGRPVRVRGLNGYAAVIPWEDLRRFDPILAMTVDGHAIAVRSKGPIVVIYPYDEHADLSRATYSDRAVWHVDELVAM